MVMAISYNTNPFIVNCSIQKGPSYVSENSHHNNNIPLFSIFKVSIYLVLILHIFAAKETDWLVN